MDILKTLLVEDNAGYRDVLKSALMNRYAELTVKEAASEKDAMATMRTFHPDLIFMDIHLDGGDGLDLTRRIKSDFPATVIVILTQDDVPEYHYAAMECGADYFFSKAVPLASIFGLIDSVLTVKQNHH